MLRILDLFCGGGGTAMGMIQAGCEVIGVDIDPRCKKWYPGIFIRHNVFALDQMLDWPRILAKTNLIWASPTCRKWSTMTQVRGDPDDHPDQIGDTRKMLEHLDKPYIIENVPKAPLRKDVWLCGLMFNLPLYRHRIFECSFPVAQPEHPKHAGQQKYSVVGRVSTQKQHGSEGYYKVKAAWPIAMGISHIGVNATTASGHNMFSQAIPPAFSKYLIEQFIAQVKSNESK